MKLICYFMITLFLGINISEVRKLYPESADSKENAESFLNKLEGVNENSNATLLCYKGAAIAMQARFEKTVKEKKSSLKKGAAIIEKAIASDPKIVELRMIRLSIQESLPKIVGYSKSIKVDHDFILANFSTSPSEIKSYLRDFVMQSKSFSKSEQAIIKN